MLNGLNENLTRQLHVGMKYKISYHLIELKYSILASDNIYMKQQKKYNFFELTCFTD